MAYLLLFYSVNVKKLAGPKLINIFKEVVMKKGLIFGLVCVFAVTLFAQENTNNSGEFNELKKQIEEKVMKQLNELPAQVQEQLREAKQAAEAAQEMIKKMQGEGKTPEEIEQHMAQTREQAQKQLEVAIQKMNQASEQVKAQIREAADDVQKKLQAKEGEIKQIQKNKP